MIKHFCSGRLENFCLRERIHLGDTLIALNVIYNLCKQERFSAALYAHNMHVVRQLMEVFDYEGLIVPCAMRKSPMFNDIKFGLPLQTGEYHDNNWCGEIFGTSTLQMQSIRCFELPKHKLGKHDRDNYTCFHIMGNSEQWNKPRLKSWEVEAFMKLFCDQESVLVGGPADKPFQGRSSHFADIKRQCEFMLRSSGFRGVDSGMSHLAGTLGLDGDVVVQAIEEGYHRCVERAFNFMYPTLRMHSRGALKSCFAGGSVQ